MTTHLELHDVNLMAVTVASWLYTTIQVTTDSPWPQYMSVDLRPHNINTDRLPSDTQHKSTVTLRSTPLGVIGGL